MRFPLHITTDMMKWQVKNWWRGNKRYPVVLMLEPLHTCNLACIGCSPERYKGELKDRLPLEQCLEAVDESRRAGGLDLRRRADDLSRSSCRSSKPSSRGSGTSTSARTRSCSIASSRRRRPHPRLSINVHLDGMRETHDLVCDRAGRVRQGRRDDPRSGLSLGYHVCTNTTIFRETSVEEIEELCELLTDLGVDGMLVSPGYHYEALEGDHFLFREGDPREVQARARALEASTRSTPRRSSSSSPPASATIRARRGATSRARRTAGRAPAT